MADTTRDIPTRSPQSRYRQWDVENPEVYEAFRARTLELIQAGRKRYSGFAIIGVIRFHADIQTNGTPYKINNNMIPYYARKFAREFPEHRDFFETRKSKLDL